MNGFSDWTVGKHHHHSLYSNEWHDSLCVSARRVCIILARSQHNSICWWTSINGLFFYGCEVQNGFSFTGLLKNKNIQSMPGMQNLTHSLLMEICQSMQCIGKDSGSQTRLSQSSNSQSKEEWGYERGGRMRMIRLDVCALTPSLKAAEVIIANKRKKKAQINLWYTLAYGVGKKREENGKQRWI